MISYMNKYILLIVFTTFSILIPPVFGDEHNMTEKQKLSYALGVFFAQSVSQQDINMDVKHFMAAVADVLNKNQPKLSVEEIQSIFATFQQQEQEKRTRQATANNQAGKEFLEQNKTKEGVVELDNGLQYKILRPGTGANPEPDSEVTVHYRGTLLNGNEFDSSYQRNQPATLVLNRVIAGWQQALPLMKTGAKWQLYIPPELGYGTLGQGAIGPDETLIFEVELIAVH